MTIEMLIGRATIAWLGVRVTGASIVYIGGIARDFQDIRRRKNTLKYPQARRKRTRPLVSLLLIACNDEDSVVQSLESIRKSSYRKHEIIVIDNASTDRTAQITRKYIKAHPKKSIRLVRKRKHVDSIESHLSSVHRHINGELLLALDAKTIVAKDALRTAVRYLEEHAFEAVMLNTTHMADKLDTPTLVMQFNDVLLRHSRKAHAFDHNDAAKFSTLYAFSGKKVHKPVAGKQGFVQDAILVKLSRITWSAIYKDVKQRAVCERTPKHFVAFARIRVVTPLLDIAAFSYVLYVAMAFQNTTLFAASWLVVSSIFAVAIWSDSSLDKKKKGILTVFIPITYLLAPLNAVLSLVSLVNIFMPRLHKRLLNARNRGRRKTNLPVPAS